MQRSSSYRGKTHADRGKSKLLYKKALEVLRFLRTFGGKPSKFLQQVAKDAGWIDKVHDACCETWGNTPPRAGGSEDCSEEILDLSTPEWLNTEEGEQIPLTPPSSTLPPQGTTETDGSGTGLGEQIPVTPDWPWGDERVPLPRRRVQQEDTTPAQGEALASRPRVYSGRVKEAWKIQSKLASPTTPAVEEDGAWQWKAPTPSERVSPE